jgi:hypothetical protein
LGQANGTEEFVTATMKQPTEKQRRLVMFYLQLGSQVESWFAANPESKASREDAGVMVSRTLALPHVKAYLAKLREDTEAKMQRLREDKELEIYKLREATETALADDLRNNPLIATIRQRKEWLTGVMRTDDYPIGARLQAVDVLNRMEGVYVDKVQGVFVHVNPEAQAELKKYTLQELLELRALMAPKGPDGNANQA